MHPSDDFLTTISENSAADLALLRRWCGICSGTFHLPGLRALADELTTAFSSLGEVRRIDLPPSTTTNEDGEEIQAQLGQALSIVKRPDAPLRVLLMIHYDTVYSPVDPFNSVTVRADGTWNGPGVVDAKGGIIVLLAALRALEASPFAEAIGWEVLLNPDEEIGSPGSAVLIGQAARRNHLALLFEPALPDGTLVGARKGSGNFTVVFRGRAAHAGRDFASGRNAIVALSQFVQRADERARSLGGGITLNCGHITGGGAVNIVPHLAIARFNARAATVSEVGQVNGLFADLVADLNRQDGISASLHGSFSSPPKPLDDRSLALLHLIADCGTQLGINVQWQSSGGTCDGNRIAAAGLPVVDTLGPVGGNLHGPQEYLVPASIAERAGLTASVLMRIARKGFAG